MDGHMPAILWNWVTGLFVVTLNCVSLWSLRPWGPLSLLSASYSPEEAVAQDMLPSLA
jgi:hypothetical protein